MAKFNKAPPRVPPWDGVVEWVASGRLDVHDAAALQALARGEAEDHQQKRALAFIVEKVCGTGMTFWPDSDRATCFAEGKRFVGQQITNLLRLNLAVLTAQTKE